MNTNSTTANGGSSSSSQAGTEVRPVAGVGMVANPRRTRI